MNHRDNKDRNKITKEEFIDGQAEIIELYKQMVQWFWF